MPMTVLRSMRPSDCSSTSFMVKSVGPGIGGRADCEVERGALAATAEGLLSGAMAWDARRAVCRVR